jgi:hypothetical protein
MRTLLIVLAAAFFTEAASADEIYLKGGGQLSGRIVSRTDAKIEVDIGAGRIGVPASSVVRIEEGQSAFEQYEERASRIAPSDADGWVALAGWAESKGLGTQARQAYERALAADPSDPRANEALGNVNLEGRWMSEEESYKARGYVQHEGEWMTPADREAALRARAAEEQRDREQRAAETRAREAEARAAEAEARAREAEAQASDEIYYGGYGWGGGPAYWPVRPVVNPPARPIARPRAR